MSQVGPGHPAGDFKWCLVGHRGTERWPSPCRPHLAKRPRVGQGFRPPRPHGRGICHLREMGSSPMETRPAPMATARRLGFMEATQSHPKATAPAHPRVPSCADSRIAKYSSTQPELSGSEGMRSPLLNPSGSERQQRPQTLSLSATHACVHTHTHVYPLPQVTCVHTCMRTPHKSYARVHRHAHVGAHAHPQATCVCTHGHAHTHVHVHTPTHTHVLTHTHTTHTHKPHTYTCSCNHAHIRAHTETHTCTLINTHAHMHS